MNPNTNTAPASMAAHTPTPWRAVPCTTREGFTIAQAPVNARGEQNVAIAANIAQLGNNSADAAFIVRACNSHAQLVAALEWTQKIICAYLDAETQAERDYLWKDIEHAHKTNSAALTAATEGGAM